MMFAAKAIPALSLALLLGLSAPTSKPTMTQRAPF